MMTGDMLSTKPQASELADVPRRVRRMVLVVPALALLGSAIAMLLDPRLGLLGTAFVLGWTQLVGL
jgi:hypothetical protein